MANMPVPELEKFFAAGISSWSDIDDILKRLSDDSPPLKQLSQKEFKALISKGIAFVTFDFGIDGAVL